MAVISIVGAPGVGKSFLVKQLAAITQNPAFFEGEEGTIPEEILENIFNGGDPIKRWRFFVENRKKYLEKAILISQKLNIDCYVDGAILTTKATDAIEPPQFRPILKQMLKKYLYLKSDLIVLLTCNRNNLKKFTKLRSRKSELTSQAINRAWKIQNKFIELAKKEENLIIIDRNSLEFTKEKDLKFVLEKITNQLNK